MQYQFKIENQDFNVQVNEPEAGVLQVLVNGTPYKVLVGKSAAAAPPAAASGSRRLPPTDTPAVPAPAAVATPMLHGTDGAVQAPIPGLILEIKVRIGDKVQAGQSVAVMEAMKMENNLTAHLSGVVKEILVQKGAEVATGDVILRIG